MPTPTPVTIEVKLPGRRVSSRQLSTPLPPHQVDLYRFAPRKDIAKYVEMLELDSQARQAVAYHSNLVISLIGEYSHPDERIQEFVRFSLRQMRGDYGATLRWLLRAPVIGFALSEKVWKQMIFEGRTVWLYDALTPIKSQSVSYNGIRMAQGTGQPEQIVQWAEYGTGITIPGEKVIHWAYEDLGDGYGTPLGKGMLPIYQGKLKAANMWLTGLQRMAQPYIYEKFMDEKVEDPATGVEVNLVEVLSQNWADADGGSVILRPVSQSEIEGGLPNAEVLNTTGFDEAFERYVKHQDKLYYLALGIPALVVMEPEFGSRAQSIVHSDTAKLCAVPLAEEFVEVCLIRDWVKPLLDVNFGEQEGYGTFPVAIPLNVDTLGAQLDALNKAGYIGMNVDFRLYQKMQALIPDILPEFEEAEFSATQLALPQQQPALPAGQQGAPEELGV